MEFIRRDKAVLQMKKALHTASLFSKDPNRKVACLMVKPGNFSVLAESWNGFVAGWSGDTAETWSSQEAKSRAPVRHAERNAIDFSARNGVALEGAIAIVTYMPCRDCAASLAQVGISGIVTITPDFNHHRWGESFRDSYNLIQDLKLPILFLDPEEVISLPSSI